MELGRLGTGQLAGPARARLRAPLHPGGTQCRGKLRGPRGKGRHEPAGRPLDPASFVTGYGRFPPGASPGSRRGLGASNSEENARGSLLPGEAYRRMVVPQGDSCEFLSSCGRGMGGGAGAGGLGAGPWAGRVCSISATGTAEAAGNISAGGAAGVTGDDTANDVNS